MLRPKLCIGLSAMLALCLLAACRSADTIAAEQAAQAQADLDQGRLGEARRAITKAMAARDDILENWLLKAHIDLKMGDRSSAFSDYEFALQLDHSNLEALQALCQLGLTFGTPDGIDRYADQLLLLSPGSPIALVAKGNIALARHDADTATGLADRVLAQTPQDLPALSLKSRIMLAQGHFAQAAALIEQTADTPGDLVAKLKLLKDVYAQANDRPDYVQAVRRLAAAAPRDADLQIGYADVLYQNGQPDQARAVIRAAMAAHPSDLQAAAAILNLWQEAGSPAFDPGRIAADAASQSLLMKADYAQFANEMGHPALAIAILQGSAAGEPNAQNANAKAALAYAIGVTGQADQAMPALNAILDDDHDPDQPFALLARARLLAAAHDYRGAVRDARLLVASDGASVTGRLALADILHASGSADLSLSALREGLRAIPGSARLAARLAATLAAQGDRDQAGQVALDLYRIAPMNQRAIDLLHVYGIPVPAFAAAT